MSDYASVNKEIKDFLSKRNKEDVNPPLTLSNKHSNLRHLLESLHQTYNEINSCLKSQNITGVKDAILRSDIKMTMVNESLLESLKQLTIDKDELVEEKQKIRREKRDLVDELNKLKNQFARIENTYKNKKATIDELNKIVRDQKSRLSHSNSETQKANKELERIKIKVSELENLRIKSMDRFSSYENEMIALNKLVIDKEEACRKIRNVKTEEETKNQELKIRISEFEMKLNSLEEKHRNKERSLILCNEEMSKIIMENRKYLSDNEKYKNSSIYYENLYKNLNSQNSFLNKQLNRMIECEKYSKDGLIFFEKAEETENNLKNQISTLKQERERLIEENDDLKEKLEENLYKINPADDTQVLNEKLEDLIRLNKDYKAKISELENKVKNKNTHKTLETENPSKDLVTRNPNYEHNTWHKNHHAFNAVVPNNLNFPRPVQNQNNFRNYFTAPKPTFTSPINSYKQNFNDRKSFKPIPNDFKTPLFSNLLPNKPEPMLYFNKKPEIVTAKRPEINLSTDYEEKDIEGLPGDIGDSIDSIKIMNVGLNEKNNIDKKQGPILGNLHRTKTQKEDNKNFIPLGTDQIKDDTNFVDEELIKNMIKLNTEGIKKPKPRRKYTRKPKNDFIFKDPFDVSSEDSSKSCHTTSTLKEMINKTENLKKRFENLEHNLKNAEKSDEEKLRDQMKAYNSYYSDINLKEDDPDIL